MKYIKLFESFNKRSFDKLDPIDVENEMIDAIDDSSVKITSQKKYMEISYINGIVYQEFGYSRSFNFSPLFEDDNISNPIYPKFIPQESILLNIKFSHPKYRAKGNLYISGYCKSMLKHWLTKINIVYDVNIFFANLSENHIEEPMSNIIVIIQPKHKIVESASETNNLLIVDVQKSFKKFFTEMYINELKKYSNTFKNVYQLWDNHVDGKNVDKDYLYDKNEEDKNDHHDLYDFPNQKDVIEKRYNYDVDVNFYKKILDPSTFKQIKSQEKNLKKGQYFPTTEGTIIVFIGNNHQWFQVPKKLYDLFQQLKGKEITIVGGADSECLEDVVTAGESMGVKMKRDWKYIYSASNCPI